MIRPPPRFEASAGFWNQFCRRNWEKLPAVLPGVTQRPLATPDELFPALVEAAERHRSGASVPYRLYVDLALGGKHPGPYAEVELQDSQHFLPQREDGTLERYLARLIEQLRGLRFGLILNHYVSMGASQWLRVYQFLSGLAERAGIPANCVVDIFIGNYRATPFGVHKDTQGVFTWAVIGTKRFLVWPHSRELAVRRDRANIQDYDDLRPTAQTLEIAPGAASAMYWPSSYWHVAEAVDDLAVTASIGIDVEFDFIQRAAVDAVKRPPNLLLASLPGLAKRSQSHAGGLPKTWSKTLAALRTAAGPELERDLMQRWLARVTTLGLPPIPPRTELALRDQDFVRSSDDASFVWRNLGEETLVVAYGHCFTLPSHPGILRLLRALATRSTFSVAELCRRYAGTGRIGRQLAEIDGDMIRAILERIYTTWCLDVTDPEPAGQRGRGLTSRRRSR